MHWYSEAKRDLPWRNTRDPYLIWVSEIILQQTRIEQGLPYYHQFIGAFPDIQALADADESEVLRLWQGLGYYSRARNMLHTARYLTSEHAGRFPTTYSAIKKLKGIGPYTAAAIGSFAFGIAEPVIDGNVFRFSSRYFGIADDIAKAGNRKVFEKVLREILPADQPDVFNQALMEFGALVCKPKPDCDVCPFRLSCYALIHDAVHQLPVNNKRLKMRHRVFNYQVIGFEGEWLLKKRSAGDIWTGLYDFPLVEGDWSPDAQVHQMFGEVVPPTDRVKHLLTHQRLDIGFWRLKACSKKAFRSHADKYNYRRVSLEEMLNLPKPKVVNDFVVNELIKG